MSALQPVLPGASVLDLFAGTGSLGLEALSRGGRHATFVERSGSALRLLRANIERLGATAETTVVRGDGVRHAERLEAGAYDLALADPPYGHGYAETLVRVFERTPFAAWLWVEHRSDEVLPALPDARTRRYGDTALTSIPAPE